MQFYKIEAQTEYRQIDLNRAEVCDGYDEKQDICEYTAEINNAANDGSAIFLSRKRGERSLFGGAGIDAEEVKELFVKLVQKLEIKCSDVKYDEITSDDFFRLLRIANRSNNISDDDEFLEALEITELANPRRYGLLLGDTIIPSGNDIKEMKKKAVEYLLDETLHAELDRIAATGKVEEFHGHPIHYFIETDDREIRKEAYKILLSALYDARRIKNRRYTYIDIRIGDDFSGKALKNVYKVSNGGTVVIRMLCENDIDDDTEYAGQEMQIINALADIINANRHKVLTIICLPRVCEKIKAEFREAMPRLSMVEIAEEFVGADKGRKYLKNICRENKVKADKRLLEKLDDKSTYLGAELHNIYDDWFDGKLKNDYFPQYQSAYDNATEVIKQKPKGSAYDELMEMIGLHGAKKVINDALNYAKAQKIFSDMGMTSDKPCMHMVFTGNAGTAKTSVARLTARIFKENGILSKGHLVECGRADLVGKYVGHTAPLVKQKFKEAAGGVLFIDEAYSLCESREGLYGTEAINTIVAEMENHREDIVVIFAGYPNEMDGFLNKNQGLRSRIAFHVDFDNYDEKELLEISDLIAKQKGLELSLGAKRKLETIYEEARKQNDFGNGRFCRNMIEKAKMAQASRLLQMDLQSITKADVRTIEEEDIEMPIMKKAEEEKRVIGFY